MFIFFKMKEIEMTWLLFIKQETKVQGCKKLILTQPALNVTELIGDSMRGNRIRV